MTTYQLNISVSISHIHLSYTFFAYDHPNEDKEIARVQIRMLAKSANRFVFIFAQKNDKIKCDNNVSLFVVLLLFSFAEFVHM